MHKCVGSFIVLANPVQEEATQSAVKAASQASLAPQRTPMESIRMASSEASEVK